MAAIKCAQGQKKVFLIEERERLGGVCLNEGCVPTKALLQSVHALKIMQNSEQMGIQIKGEILADHTAMAKRSQGVVTQLTSGLGMLMDINQVEVMHGSATLVGEGSFEVDGKVITGKNIIIATGTVMRKLPVKGADLPHVMYSRDALELKEIPSEIVIIGAGAIGIEFATIYKGLGAKVTVIEMLPGILPGLILKWFLTCRKFCRRKG